MEESLYQRATRRDALVAAHWPRALQEFIDRPEYSRFVPGNDSVSVHYGRRVPKILLLMSKLKLLAEFKREYTDCSYAIKVLLREIPRNCMCAGPRDFGRNVCVLHTNVRHIIEKLM